MITHKFLFLATPEVARDSCFGTDMVQGVAFATLVLDGKHAIPA